MTKKALESNPLADKEEVMKEHYCPPSKKKKDGKPSDRKATKPASRIASKATTQQASNTAIRQAGNTALHKLTIRLPKDLIKKVKRTALEQDISVQDLVKEVLNKYLE